MTAAIPVVWSDAHRRHVPSAETWVGVRMPAVELPARAEAIRAELERAGHRVVAASPHPDAAVEAVHDRALLDFLAGAWRAWDEAGLPEDPGQPEVVPYFFAHPGLLGPIEPALPAATWARTGRFAFDTMTPIGPGTWEAARASADTVLTACDLVLRGEPAAYACCRPPGHHVTRSAYGGCCYLNNAAIAAAWLREAVGGPVALLDLDAHHGNGAQSIFYDRADVITGSLHVHPGAGWFPHFLGFAREEGEGAGHGTNRNVPLAPGSGDDAWVPAVRELAWWAAAFEPRALVIALGVDAAAGDPESPLRVTADGFGAAGHALGALGLPTVVVQEGGYDLATIGGLVRTALEGLADGLAAEPPAAGHGSRYKEETDG
jgi:acetoin utilization deacetylase AcuC-like enzyme